MPRRSKGIASIAILARKWTWRSAKRAIRANTSATSARKPTTSACLNAPLEYGEFGKGQSRKYLHTYDEAVPWNQVPGTFTPWQPLPEPTDVLFYEGLHGGVVTPQHDVAKHVDLLVGVVPIVNLEWIQKLIRDTSERGHSREAVMDSVVRSMEDYINFITPQFSRTHINFQRVPTVDTSNPFAAKGIPSLDESFVVIHFRNLQGIDYPRLLAMLQGRLSRI